MESLLWSNDEELDNIELGDEPEKTEWSGNIQTSIKIKAKPIEDIEIHPNNPNKSEDDEMKDTKDLLEKLRGGSKNIIPGLNIDTIVERFINKSEEVKLALQPYKDIINNKNSTPEAIEQAEKDIETITSQFTNTIKEQFEPELNNMELQFKIIKENIKDIPEVITKFTASTAIPKVIVTGTAVGVANPATALLEGAQLKSQLSDRVNQMTNAAVSLINSAVKIHFPLPEIVITTINGISNITNALNLIPV